MAFGPRMRMTVGELEIELAPYAKEDMAGFVDGMSRLRITQYLGRQTAPTIEEEYEWYDKMRTNKARLNWGIWVIEGKTRTLIGDTTLEDITQKHTHQATSGSVIFRDEYWGKGIASAIHKARTWYAFRHLGLHRVMSAVIHGNVASRKALEKSGYQLVYVEHNTVFVDGTLHHQDNLECLNPLDSFWRQWWHDRVPKKHDRDSRQCTRDAMAWADEHVKL